VRRRFERLTNDGCVSVITIAPPQALGLEAETVMVIAVEPLRLDEIATALARHSSVRYLGAVALGFRNASEARASNFCNRSSTSRGRSWAKHRRADCDVIPLPVPINEIRGSEA
jgi:hypothetical protein